MVEDLDFDTLLFCEMVSFKVRKAFGWNRYETVDSIAFRVDKLESGFGQCNKVKFLTGDVHPAQKLILSVAIWVVNLG